MTRDAGKRSLRRRLRGLSALAITALAGACSEVELEPAPPVVTCVAPVSAAAEETGTLELGRMVGGQFVAGESGQELELVTCPSHGWCAIAALRVTPVADLGPSLCATDMGGLAIPGADPYDNTAGVRMDRASDGTYVAPVALLVAPVRHAGDSQFWSELGKPTTLSIGIDAYSSNRVLRLTGGPWQVRFVNREGFLATGSGPSDAGVAPESAVSPAFGLWAGVPGTTSVIGHPGATTAVTIQLTGQRAGLPVNFEAGPLPSGVTFTFSRTSIPATATDDEAFETLATLGVDPSVPVGTEFSLQVKATAGSYSANTIVGVNVWP